MTEVGAYYAKTHLAELLDRVSLGERITITRHGKPVAVLRAPDGEHDRTVDEAVDALLALRERLSLGGELTVGKLLEEDGRA